MQKVIFTRGIPASGKSSWARGFIQGNPGWTRVNLDDIRAMSGIPWSKSVEKLHTKVQDQAILAALRAGMNVIVDNTHLHKHGPDHVVQLLWEEGIEVEYSIQDFLDVHWSTCVDRNILRRVSPTADDSKTVPMEAMQNMKVTLEREQAKGLWTVEELTAKYPKIETHYNPEALPAIIIDIDGTLADNDHRSPYDYSQCGNDALWEDVAQLAHAMYHAGNVVILCSGRDSEFRPETEKWLDHHNVSHDFLFMREQGDTRRDSVVKLELFEKNIRDKFHVKFAVDDRDRVVSIWRQLGFRCFQVQPGDF